MKTPRRQARSSVMSRELPSPGWISGRDKIFSPKSPSPLRRITRRSSVYQSKTARADVAKFKMPASLKSPPGAKTRARRSSVYQKGRQNILSPKNLPVSSRTRRSSIYMRRTNVDTEFSKVFRTPLKPAESVKTVSREDGIASNATSDSKKKSITKQDDHPTPPSKLRKKSPASQKAKSPVVKISPMKSFLSPAATAKTPVNKHKSPKPARSARKSNSVKSVTTKTPLQKSETPVVEKDVSAMKVKRTKLRRSSKSPESLRKTRVLDAKSPVQLKKTPVSKLKSPKVRRSSRKSAKKSVETPASLDTVKTLSFKKHLATSTPSKSVEQIATKSFYGTPQETLTRNDDLIVFSAKPVSAAKPQQKKITLTTPDVKSNKKTKSGVKRLPARKTPAVKRQLVESEDDSTPVAVKLRKIEMEVQNARKKVIKKGLKSGEELEETKTSEEEAQKSKLKLSPEEMITVLKSVHEEERQEKRKNSESPEHRQQKFARLADDLTTPRMRRMAKRTSPKKLAELAERKDMLKEEWVSQGDSSFLSETMNSDSRSSRCIIL